MKSAANTDATCRRVYAVTPQSGPAPPAPPESPYAPGRANRWLLLQLALPPAAAAAKIPLRSATAGAKHRRVEELRECHAPLPALSGNLLGPLSRTPPCEISTAPAGAKTCLPEKTPATGRSLHCAS